MNFGPTGKHGQGKVHASDEGELNLGVAADSVHGVVVVNFGSPVAWFALPPKDARKFAQLLLKNAAKLEEAPLPSLPV